MCKFLSALPALAFVTLLSAPAIAQTSGSSPDPERAGGNLAELNKKALQGNTRAQLQLGLAFEFGDGVEKNKGEAMHWYRIAADRGDPVAQTNLAYLYESGANGSPDPTEAARWYLRAAVSGFARAQFNLGTLYLQGAGVERSYEEAAFWIGKASDAGCPAAMTALGYLYEIGKGVPQDTRKAHELSQKAAKNEKKNDPNTCTQLVTNLLAK